MTRIVYLAVALLSLSVGCSGGCFDEYVEHPLLPGEYVFELDDTTDPIVRDQFPNAADGPVFLLMQASTATVSYATTDGTQVEVVMELGPVGLSGSE